MGANCDSMIDSIRRGFAREGREISPAVLYSMRNTPRNRFVPEEQQAWAWEDHPLPIGHEQTISQPFIVAIMTDLLAPQKSERILEIGSGSGYQAAVLSPLVDELYGIEIIEPLAESASRINHKLGNSNVHIRAGDGQQGWPEHAPYDGIIVTAATPEVPETWVNQLKVGGRIVLPLGAIGGIQQLVVATKNRQGEMEQREILACRFVPLTGG